MRRGEPRSEEPGRLELVAMVAFGVGCVLAVVALPVVAWLQLLPVAPAWMNSALLSAAVLPVVLAPLMVTTLAALRRRRRR